MRSATKIAAVALLIVFLAGCRHKSRSAPPPPAAAQAPSLPPTQMASEIPATPPSVPVADRPIKLDTAPPPATERPSSHARPRRTTRRRARSGTQESAQQETPKGSAPVQAQAPQPPAQDAQMTTGQQPSEESPIGQLSTANDSSNTADRHALVDQINSIETHLNGIKRQLTSDEQKTATQVRTFVTRAREALKVDDLDAARTLSTKAELLLQELTKD